MITLFMGIWLQPRNQPTFSVCQLPASSLASTFYSLKRLFSFSFLLPLPPDPFSQSSPFLNKYIYLCPLSPSLSVCALISLGSQLQHTYAFSSQKKKIKRQIGTHTYTWTHIHTPLCIYICTCTYTRLYHVDYLGMSTSGCNNLNMCLLWAPSRPVCGNRSLWNQINYLCQFPQDQQNKLLITNLYRRLES